MNFLIDSLSTILPIVVVILLYPRFPRIVKKIKTEKLPQEIFDDLKTRSFPEYYKIYYWIFAIFWLIVVLGGTFVILFLSINLFYDIQKFVFGNNTIYFTSFANLIFGLIMFFAGFLWWGGLSFFLIWRPLPKSIRDYLRADSIKKWNWGSDEWSFTKYLCKVGVLIILGALPIIYLASNIYVAVSSENIAYHPFFSLKARTYSFGEIEQLNVSFNQYSKDISSSIKIFTKSGDEIELSAPIQIGRGGLLDNTQGIKELYKTFRDRGVLVNIEQLSAESVNRIQLFCPEKQRTFYTMFELDYPVVPHDGCL